MITDSRIEALLAVDREAVLELLREAYYAQNVQPYRLDEKLGGWPGGVWLGTLTQQLIREAVYTDYHPNRDHLWQWQHKVCGMAAGALPPSEEGAYNQ